ncbi:DDE-type integrase/transposase/recombinase [Paenibacillus sp. FSL F4-0236]|uniref:DDE-type integrase/transposase/recombinase n=1 Tax=Paenibacillus sp. FSL F4-0236 TaxID=2954731 RepID=UPI0030F81411
MKNILISKRTLPTKNYALSCRRKESISISAIKDLFNYEIIAYQMSAKNDNELVLRTFRQSWTQQQDVTGLIVHSDQKFHYTSHAYHDMLSKVGVRISISRRGNCHAYTKTIRNSNSLL